MNQKKTNTEKFVSSYIYTNPSDRKLSRFLIDDIWQVEDSTEESKSFTINLKPLMEGLSVEYKITMKLIFLRQLKINGNIIDSKERSLKHKIDSIAHCSRALKATNISSLKDLNENNIHDFITNIITKKDGDIYSKNTIVHAIKLFLASASNPIHQYPDLPYIYISWDMFLSFAKPVVSNSVDWLEWRRGGSLGGFPIELAVVILDESLNITNDIEKLRIARAYVKGCRNAQFEDSNIKLGNIGRILDRLEYKECGIDSKGFFMIDVHKQSYGCKVYLPDIQNKYGHMSFITAKCIFDEFIKLGGKPEHFNSFVNLTNINKIIHNQMYACAAIIQILSGIRKSELQSLNRSSFKKEINNVTSFKSAIKKTNHSIETIRMISNVAWDAVQIAKSLHQPSLCHLNENITDKLLKINVPWRKTIISGSCWWGIKSGLTLWMKKILKKRVVDLDLESIPSPSSHRFRHTWAEIALRRFDGNVPEAIRQYFRHAHGSSNTLAYITSKVKQELPLLQRDYICELLGRVDKKNLDVFGPVGNYISKKLNEVDVLSDDEIEDLASEFDKLIPYEYGYCMIPKHQKTQAKCYDKATNSPNYNDAKFSLCGGCPGSLKLLSHRNAILRIGMREQEVIKSRKSQGLMFLADQSQKILKLCESAIKQMDNKIPVNIIDEELNNEPV